MYIYMHHNTHDSQKIFFQFDLHKNYITLKCFAQKTLFDEKERITV